MAKLTWQELSPGLRKLIAIVGVVQVALLSLAQLDISRRPENHIRGSKALWRVLALINFVGPIGYFCIGRRKDAVQPLNQRRG